MLDIATPEGQLSVLSASSTLSVGPSYFRSDNRLQFVSEAFKTFSQVIGFTHVPSSPHYPWNNGFIESQVKIVKQALTSKDCKTSSDKVSKS